jgi:hypothetical protein
MNPPIVYALTNPTAQRTSRMTAMVQSIFLTPAAQSRRFFTACDHIGRFRPTWASASVRNADPRLSDSRPGVCPMVYGVFRGGNGVAGFLRRSFLIGRRFRLDLLRRHLHHVGGRRVAGSVPGINPVMVGRARFDGPVAEGRDMRPHLADLYEWLARAVTDGSLDAEPESAGLGPAFGPCQDHLATADRYSHQVDRCARKGERRRSVGHPSSSLLRRKQVVNIPPVGTGNHPMDSIS